MTAVGEAKKPGSASCRAELHHRKRMPIASPERPVLAWLGKMASFPSTPSGSSGLCRSFTGENPPTGMVPSGDAALRDLAARPRRNPVAVTWGGFLLLFFFPAEMVGA